MMSETSGRAHGSGSDRGVSKNEVFEIVNPKSNRKALAKGSRNKSGELPFLDKWDGTPESKTRLHKGAEVVFRAVAAELDLKKGEFDVRSNPMGPAIGGVIYLNMPTLRMWIDGGYGFHSWGKSGEMGRRVDSYVTARRCVGGKDVDFEHDLAVDWELLWDVKMLARVLRLEGFVR